MLNINNYFDYSGDFGKFQKTLDRTGIDYDVTNLSGATESEIEGHVKYLIANKYVRLSKVTGQEYDIEALKNMSAEDISRLFAIRFAVKKESPVC